MASIVSFTSTATTQAANLTRFSVPSDCFLDQQATETTAQMIMQTAGTMSYLYAMITANTVTATSTIRVRVNTANGNEVLSVASSTTGEFEDQNNTDALVATDVVNYSVVTGATGTSILIRSLSKIFSATGTTMKRFDSNTSQVQATASTTFFINLSGSTVYRTSEGPTQWQVRNAGTIANGSVFVTGNTRTNSTVRNRLNTANGTLVITVTASTNGLFQDTTHSDAIVSGDLINYSLLTGTGTNNCTFEQFSCEFTSTDNTFSFLNSGANNNIGTSVTEYFPPAGGGTDINSTTEANYDVKPRMPFTANNLGVRITGNSISATSTLTLRKNSANTALVASITASTSAVFEDTTHSVVILRDDEIDYQIVTGSTGTTLNTILISMVGVFRIDPRGSNLLTMGVGTN